MSEHGHSSHGGGYEKRDTTARPIVLFGVGLLALVIVSLLLMGGLFSFYDVRETRLDQSASPLGAVTLPPEPRLQVTPGQDLVGVLADARYRPHFRLDIVKTERRDQRAKRPGG